MEVVGALASSLQIISQCGIVTVTLIKWVESVRTVDERIDAFIHEVSALRMTYEGLSRSLKDPSMLEGARITNRDVGGHLWSQMSRTLHDCEATMNRIAEILTKIQSSSNILRPVVKQLKESLHSGELVRLREQIVMFNSSLQLPMQMITLTMQLRQQEVTTAHQLHLNEQLALLRRGIERIERMSRELSQPRRTDTMSGTTVVNDVSDKTWFENMENYVGTAKRFLNSASVAASSRSAPSTDHHDDDSPIANDARRGSSFMPLTHQKLKTISMYVDDVVPVESGTGSGTPLPSDIHSDVDIQLDAIDDSDDDDVDLQLLQALLQNGSAELVRLNYAAAEDNYKEALVVSQGNNFGTRTACSTADIALMLGECLARQEKFDETIELLSPLASGSNLGNDVLPSSTISTFSSSQLDFDKGQMLAANHLLGEVYLKKSDYSNAEICCVQAFKGRKRLLGDDHVKTVESVHLVIDMYKAKGQNARAEAHRVFLKPSRNSQPALTGSGDSSRTPPPRPADPIPIPQISSPGRPRRPTFSFSSPFRRSEKLENAPTSAPMSRSMNTTNSPFLVADEFNHLSTSPNDTSSLHMGSDIRPTNLQLRQDSSQSYGSFTHVQHWTTQSDINSQGLVHQRTRSSLSKTPTLYANMSHCEMEQRFVEVSSLCKSGKTSKAAERGMVFLQQYDPDSAILVHRSAELKENIKKSKTKGLAGSGHGFTPLHFFCSLKYEPLMEIDILLGLEANPNAVAHKAGYVKADPFVPLTLAVERGHENIVRMLLEHGAIWQADIMRSGSRFNADRDSIHPLLQACQKSNIKIVDILLEHKIELTEELFPRLSWHGNSLLHEACFKCDLELVELLMAFSRRRGGLHDVGYSFIGSPSQQDEFGMTPIMYAVDMRECNEKLRAHKSRSRIPCLSLLLELNGDVGVKEMDEGAIMIDHPQRSEPRASTTSLHLQDKRGNTVYWYADESRGGDAGLKTFLDEQSRKSQLIEL